MLVLSRRADQQIVFPNLDVRLTVLQVKGKVVKLGIEAPKDVPILRPETCDDLQFPSGVRLEQSSIDRHQLRNHLNAINLGLRLFQKQTEVGRGQEAEKTMQRVIEELQKLDSEIGQAKSKVKSAGIATTTRLLVVDDDENERTLLSGLLKMHGFEVNTAANGLEAMDFLSHNELPDYVLLDMKMPKVDGPSMLRQIRSDDRLANVTIFAVSGTSPDDLGIEGGIAGWFPKPLDPERLIKAMTKGHPAANSATALM
ncbi:response regulator [Rubinisphaera margarita]|uniref:response regulator n=1 Tax=Rubinisphaera margarita TaxID=2909586 RepID=UPI001EE866AE|nr:response regulator [Rubinisphaera margarita]MCG6156985.1 response regulator [Rubinisphaera margarita]